MRANVGQPKIPFFLVGSVRSGTTVLRLMLGHHSQICRCEEMDYVTPELVSKQPVVVSEYIERLRRDRGFLLSGYSIREDLDFDGLVHDFLSQRLSIDGAPVVGATVHNHFDELPRIFPQAKYVFLRRDPRDVARSCMKMGWAGSAWNGATFWLNANAAWKRLRKQVPDVNCHELSYEQLVADTVGTMTDLCAFLGVEFESSMMEIEKDTTYEQLSPNVAQSWRDSASQAEIVQVEARVGEQQLAAHGYQPSGLPPMKVTPTRQLRIRMGDMLGKCRRRIQIYGLSLWFQSLLSRRLPSRRYRHHVQKRIDAVDNAHLK